MNSQYASTYQSYLLRLWRDTPNSPWRASLQSSATEALQHFATVDELWTFLMAQMAVQEDDGAAAEQDSGTVRQ
ncbi:MAG: hypothetical protein R3C14_32105 [Caldilineaceae bacterium]